LSTVRQETVMRRPVIACLLMALAAPAAAQRPPATGTPPAPPPQSLDIQAKRPLPTGKYAVDLDTDTALARDLRRTVMEKLAARGNQVGFSGGHVMKLQVDLSQHFAGGRTPESVLAPPRDQVAPRSERGDVRPPIPERSVRDLAPKPDAPTERLHLTLTLHGARSGEVAWVAYATCDFKDGRALDTGRAMINAIFANPNVTRRGDANCPIDPRTGVDRPPARGR
jgi:hypothetical protein